MSLMRQTLRVTSLRGQGASSGTPRAYPAHCVRRHRIDAAIANPPPMHIRMQKILRLGQLLQRSIEYPNKLLGFLSPKPGRYWF